MADLYWRGGSGNWSDTTHWDTTDGGLGPHAAPTSTDNAHFTALSNATAYTVTNDVSAVCKDLMFDAAPLTSGTITFARNGNTVTISGACKLLSGMTLSGSGTWTFNATSGTNNITCNTVSPSSVVFNGVGGTWQLQDTFTGAGTITVTNGTLDLNSKTVSCTQFSGGSGGTVTFGSSALTCSTGWAAGSCTLNIGTGSISSGLVFAGGGNTYNTVTVTGNSITGANTFATLSINNSSSKTISANQIITGTLTITGGAASSRLSITSDTFGTQRTLTAAAVSLTDVLFQDIVGAGVASSFTGTRIGDLGNNSGITFTNASNKYYVGNTANFTGTVWATSSGGGTSSDNYPLPQDTAIFDSNSFSANSQTITLNASAAILPTLDFSAMTNRSSITLASGTNTPVFYGGLILTTATGFATTGTGLFTFSKQGSMILDTKGLTITQPITINAVNGTLSLGGNSTLGNGLTFTVTNGTLDLNSYTLSTSLFASSNSNVRTIKGTGGGKLSVTRTNTSTSFNMGTSTNATIDRSGNWTLEVAGNTTNTRTFAGGGLTLPALAFVNTTASGRMDITGNNTFKNISISTPPQSIRFTGGGTTTIEDSGASLPSGTSGNLITYQTVSGTSAYHFTKSGGGMVNCDYISISRSTADQTNTFFAGHNSTDGGNNTSWKFGDGFQGDYSQSITLTDIEAAGVVLAASISDSIVSIGTESGTVSTPGSITESITSIDTPDISGNTYQSDNTDNITSVATLDGLLLLNGSISDSITCTTTESGTLEYLSSESESFTLVDTVDRYFETLSSSIDSITLVDTVDRLWEAGGAGVETVGMADTLSGTLTLIADSTNSISLIDTISSQIDFIFTITESITATDNSGYAGESYTRDQSESIIIVDTEDSTIAFSGLATNSITCVDTVGISVTKIGSITESITSTTTQGGSLILVGARIDALSSIATHGYINLFQANRTETLSLITTENVSGTWNVSLVENLESQDNIRIRIESFTGKFARLNANIRTITQSSP